jgi:hypothetical protein
MGFEVGKAYTIRQWDDMAKEFGAVVHIIKISDKKHRFYGPMLNMCGKSFNVDRINFDGSVSVLFAGWHMLYEYEMTEEYKKEREAKMSKEDEVMPKYDLTKEGPVLSLEPVLVEVSDDNIEFEGPYMLVYIDDAEIKYCVVGADDNVYGDWYKYAKHYEPIPTPTPKTVPMGYSDIVQLVKNGCFFHCKHSDYPTFNPSVEYLNVDHMDYQTCINSSAISSFKGYSVTEKSEVLPFTKEVSV